MSLRAAGLATVIAVFTWAASLPVAAQDPADPITEAPERIVWDKTPIKLTLRVGRERRVSFPVDVRVGVSPALADVLRTQSVDGTVYWLATKTFPTTRVQVREIDSGRVYLLDLQAKDNEGGNTPVEIHFRTSASDSDGSDSPEDTAERLDYVALTRYAAHQMYAPKRLLRDPPGVFRARLNVKKPVPLVRGGTVEALPLAAWRGGGLYVTAVKLRNITNGPVTLDPRELRGQWLTATFQHARLLPHGDEADTTCVYLISARPFEESL